jgi:hypothetical protein
LDCGQVAELYGGGYMHSPFCGNNKSYISAFIALDNLFNRFRVNRGCVCRFYPDRKCVNGGRNLLIVTGPKEADFRTVKRILDHNLSA